MPAAPDDILRILYSVVRAFRAGTPPWNPDTSLADALHLRSTFVFHGGLPDLQESLENFFNTPIPEKALAHALRPLTTHTLRELGAFLAATVSLPEPPATPDAALDSLTALLRARRCRRKVPAPEAPLEPFARRFPYELSVAIALLSRGRLGFGILPTVSPRMRRFGRLFVAMFIAALLSGATAAVLDALNPGHPGPACIFLAAALVLAIAAVTLLMLSNTLLARPGDITYPAFPWPTLRHLAAALADSACFNGNSTAK
jgi:hypothetical protein